MTMRQSAPGGAASTRSTAGVRLRPPALTQTARRPPNSGTVWASSTSRSGSSASASPSMRASENGIAGIVDGGGDQGIDALAYQAGIGSVDEDDRGGSDRVAR